MDGLAESGYANLAFPGRPGARSLLFVGLGFRGLGFSGLGFKV